MCLSREEHAEYCRILATPELSDSDAERREYLFGKMVRDKVCTNPVTIPDFSGASTSMMESVQAA